MRREGLDVQRHFKNKPDKPEKKTLKEISDEKSEASQATFIKRQKQEESRWRDAPEMGECEEGE